MYKLQPGCNFIWILLAVGRKTDRKLAVSIYKKAERIFLVIDSLRDFEILLADVNFIFMAVFYTVTVKVGPLGACPAARPCAWH
jgi:hypothetical protein